MRVVARICFKPMNFRSDNILGCPPEILAALARANADHFIDRQDEDLTVADLARLGRAHDRVDCLGRRVVSNRDFKFHLGQKIHGVLGATVDFSVALLPTESLHFRHRHTFDPGGGERLRVWCSLRTLPVQKGDSRHEGTAPAERRESSMPHLSRSNARRASCRQ